METMIWHKNRVVIFLAITLLGSILLNLNNDWTINLLAVLKTWTLNWIVPAFIFLNYCFENKED